MALQSGAKPLGASLASTVPYVGLCGALRIHVHKRIVACGRRAKGAEGRRTLVGLLHGSSRGASHRGMDTSSIAAVTGLSEKEVDVVIKTKCNSDLTQVQQALDLYLEAQSGPFCKEVAADGWAESGKPRRGKKVGAAATPRRSAALPAGKLRRQCAGTRHPGWLPLHVLPARAACACCAVAPPVPIAACADRC